MDPFLQALSELPTVLIQIRVQLEANTRMLNMIADRFGNIKFNEADAAKYLGVEPPTMYHYRQRGLAYEKTGKAVSYYQKDLDAWSQAGKVRKHAH